ncbi:uncharacterized protein sowahb [Fundulus diaphanus]
MTTDLTQDAVLVFLQSCGGSVRNSDLLLHFRPFLREHPDQVRNRELFKKFVNSVATVTKIDGVSNVVLRKKFQGHVPGAGAGRDSPEPRGTSPALSLVAPGDSERKAALPAAGIMVAESGAYLRQVEHLSSEPAGGPTQVGNQDPEISETPVSDRGKPGQNRLGSVPGPGVPAARRQDYVPEPIRGQQNLHQNPIPEPIRGQQNLHQNPIPEPIRGQQNLHQNPIPEPIRGKQNLHQNPIPEPIRGQQNLHQNPIPEPIRGKQNLHQNPIPEPIRGKQNLHQNPIPEPIRGQQNLNQNPIPEPIRGQQNLNQNLNQNPIPEPIRGQQNLNQNPIPEPIRGQQIPREVLSEPFRGHIVNRQDFVPDPTERWDTRHHGTISEPSRGHIVSRQDFVPESAGKWDSSHQGTVPEPTTGHIVSRQDFVPDPAERWDTRHHGAVSEPSKRHIVSRQDFVPEPIREQHVPRQNPVPESLRGQKTSHQDHFVEPFRGDISQDRYPGPVRGQQVLHPGPFPAPNRSPSHVPKPGRGQNISLQDHSRDPLIYPHNPIPQAVRGQQFPQNQEPFRGQQFPLNPEPQLIPYQVPVPESVRGKKISYQKPVPELLRGQQIPQNPEPLRQWQNPDPFRGQQILQNPEPLRGKQIPQNPEPPIRGKQIPQNLEPLRGKQNLEPLREQQIPQNPEPPLRGKHIPQNLEPLREQQIPQNPEPPLRGKQIPQNTELLREQQILQNPEPPIRGKQIPQNLEPLRGKQNIELLREQQTPQNPEPPLRGKQIPQNLEPLREQRIPQNTELLREQRIPQNIEPLREQQILQNPEPPLRGQKISFQDPVPEQILHQDPDPEPQTGQELPQLHQVPARRFRHRKSYKSAVSVDEDEEEEEEVQMRRGSAGGPWALNAPLSDTARVMSASSHCVIESSAPPASSSATKVPQIYIQDSEVLASQFGPGPEPGSVPAVPTRRSLPPEAERHVQAPPSKRLLDEGPAQASEPGPDQNQNLSSSHSSVFNPPSDGRSSRTPGRASSSRPGDPAASPNPQEVLQESRRTEQEPVALRSKVPLHQSMGNLYDDQPPPGQLLKMYCSSDHLHDDRQFGSSAAAMHLSTGDLYDDVESSDGSLYSPRLQHRSPAARRMSSRVRNRVYRSLETNLDQDELGGDNEAARLRRLHRISSSLSLPHHLSSSSLSSCEAHDDRDEGPRPAETEERKDVRRNVHKAGQSSVPLEAREHAWMVKGAAGAWPDIYALFREDSSLLNRQDFISGFTVLHWIAKHGDHRVLNTLWYGVEKSGLSFDVNAKSTAGQTPLHVAAIHGNKKVILLLVKNFGADVKLRDTAGKKPWQYLSDTKPEILQLLGAPPKATLAEENAEPDWKPEKERRRLRHHFSSASPSQRPRTVAQMVKVSRSSSIAALLKHKSHRF